MKLNVPIIHMIHFHEQKIKLWEYFWVYIRGMSGNLCVYFYVGKKNHLACILIENSYCFDLRKDHQNHHCHPAQLENKKGTSHSIQMTWLNSGWTMFLAGLCFRRKLWSKLEIFHFFSDLIWAKKWFLWKAAFIQE